MRALEAGADVILMPAVARERGRSRVSWRRSSPGASPRSASTTPCFGSSRREGRAAPARGTDGFARPDLQHGGHPGATSRSPSASLGSRSPSCRTSADLLPAGRDPLRARHVGLVSVAVGRARGAASSTALRARRTRRLVTAEVDPRHRRPPVRGPEAPRARTSALVVVGTCTSRRSTSPGPVHAARGARGLHPSSGTQASVSHTSSSRSATPTSSWTSPTCSRLPARLERVRGESARCGSGDARAGGHRGSGPDADSSALRDRRRLQIPGKDRIAGGR